MHFAGTRDLSLILVQMFVDTCSDSQKTRNHGDQRLS